MTELFLESKLPAAERAPLARAMETAFSADVPLVLELLFVSPEEIRALNARERGVDAVTDVLSFPAAALTPGAPIVSAQHTDCIEPAIGRKKKRMYLGSVVICTERARMQAEEYGHSYAREVCYLAVHGFLHCLGYDHESDAERGVMREQEEKIMGVLGLGREE